MTDRYPDRRLRCPDCGAYDDRWYADDGVARCLDCGGVRG